MFLRFSSFVNLISIAICARGHILNRASLPLPPLPDVSALGLATTGSFNFTQFIDHENPSLGTFQQQIWWSDEFWAGPGSPVVMFTPGEVDAAPYSGYLTNRTITGLFAQAIGAATVMVEHRYWGKSSPFNNLNTETLQYLTVKQAISDFTYFANTVEFPFDPTNSSQAHRAPWVISGGSYSGALAAWTESTSPGIFWAYHASSAPVEAIFNFWQYFQPIQQGMPRNCSNDLSLIVEYMDEVLINGSLEEQLEFKRSFGLEMIQNDDFAEALSTGLGSWQGTQFYSNYSSFFQFCDAVENVTAGAVVTPDENGIGLAKALPSFANWIKQTYSGYCLNYGSTDPKDMSCLDSHNSSNIIFQDRTVEGNLLNLQWFWLLCNEPFAYWQNGPPLGRVPIQSRLVNTEYWQRQCALLFPPEGNYTYGSSSGYTVHDLNKHTKGWHLTNTTRLTWANGEFDPWRSASVSSVFRPGGPLASTPEAPIQIIPNGFHCSDMIAKNGVFNAGVQKVIDAEVAQIKTWVNEFYEK